ncbi:MAG: hypothetical protein GYA66_06025, partial [Phyllobacteriaceae bacterium]|nr:hypothetical protein [Phyllobacteriaceae bacterium]
MIGRNILAALAACTVLAGSSLGTVPVALADEDISLTKSLMKDITDGKVKIEGDHAAVQELILKRNIPIPYSYVETLMRAPNAFGPGPACVVCHSSNDPAKSYRG